MEIRTYRETDFDGVDALWKEAFPDDPPWNRAENAIAAKVSFQPELLFVAVDQDAIVGSVMAGYDGHRGWLYAVAVRKTFRRSGLGTKLVHVGEDALRALGCGKINLQVRSTNAGIVRFYETLGYEIEDRISLSRRL
ncbi:GNAT family acetyltransferase [Qipengyuania flava]|uniref:GNAT family acetyltransferase n=1 Tax=Qipengyuania flava TaxID=192812 RepID=UPI00215A4C43|nr:GNAT family acetyltransferase [Qipengyuania flava]